MYLCVWGYLAQCGVVCRWEQSLVRGGYGGVTVRGGYPVYRLRRNLYGFTYDGGAHVGDSLGLHIGSTRGCLISFGNSDAGCVVLIGGSCSAFTGWIRAFVFGVTRTQ